MSEEVLKQALTAFSTEISDPASVNSRDEEIDYIVNFWKSHVEDKEAGSLYVCGKPGVGKTLSINAAYSKVCEWENSKRKKTSKPSSSSSSSTFPPSSTFSTSIVVKINCFDINDPKLIYQSLLDLIKGELPDNPEHRAPKRSKTVVAPITELESIITSPSTPTIVIILDEIDQLIEKDQSTLYRVFEWPLVDDSKVILIGIANALDLVQRFLPRLGRMKVEPNILDFKPYRSNQIVKILEKRLQDSGVNVSEVFEDAALELCSRKVASNYGDLRKALDVCKQTLNSRLSTIKKQEPVKGEPLISFIDMSETLSLVFTSPIIETIKDLPLHAQILLASAFLICTSSSSTVQPIESKTKKGKAAEKKPSSPSYATLMGRYSELCKDLKLKQVDKGQVGILIDNLTSNGLITLTSHKNEDMRKLTVNVCKEDMNYGLEGTLKPLQVLFE
eukprot:TRINITY_DN5073_c0_g1_i1.p1 TRINITY_DN5073_c0_g1~~TRINITY_DN5073_c0_g1_i1.p1  ORF type:complete len:447 (-),score=77.21 TRINITY_DN5073_c0_g1_i1:135-1475(-)